MLKIKSAPISQSFPNKIYTVAIRHKGCMNFYEIEAKNDKEAQKLLTAFADEKTNTQPYCAELYNQDGGKIYFSHRLC